jgi:NADPH-dependent 2,4-dienoyl-CoA reductase/sulfur reductase-like enzyme/rhodanese-related sulfurtransferase
MKVVIVGAVAGGASAAARLRRLNESAQIILFERGSEPSFANCGLPYYIGGVISERQKLLVAPKKLLKERFRLDVRTRTNVESINLEAKIITARNLETGEVTEESFDKLILAPGASPQRPDIPGADSDRLFSLRDLSDADRIHAQTVSAKSAIIIGGGFIGIEMAENFTHRGLKTTLIQRDPQLMTPFDPEMTTPLLTELIGRGVDVRLSAAPASFRTDHQFHVHLASGETVTADFGILAIGVRPENELAVNAGLKTGPRGGIVVNAHMQTSHPDVYAVGDVIESRSFPANNPVQVPLAGPANRQGRIAADHMASRNSRFRGVQGTAILGAFNIALAMTGESEKSLRRANTSYQKIYIHPANHAGYYPGAKGMSLKLLFDPASGKILGGQAVGGEGVDKRIDVISIAIQAGMTVFDLEEAELCYAPQFGSAKDPVNMAGFVASGVIRGDHPVVHLADLNEAHYLLDVRTPAEFAAGALPGAINIPIDELRERLSELPGDRPIAAYCKVGQRGYNATRLLMQHGFPVQNISGGYTTYQLTQPVVSTR